MSDIFVNERKLPLSIYDEHKVFFVDDELRCEDLPEQFRADALGFCKGPYVAYAGRLVYPVMDVRGNVMGFCGWDKFDKPKYLDSRNHGYKAKFTTFYGMEKLPEYYNNNKPVYVVEGIVCCLYLRSKGFQAIAILGSSLTKYVIQILKRMESRLIIIPDNDGFGKAGEELDTELSGENFVKQAKRYLPKARVIQSCVAKDVDDSRLFEDGKYENTFLTELRQVGISPFYFFKTIRVR